MTASQTLLEQLNATAYQVEKVFEGLAEGLYDHRTTTSAMTPAETLEHLAECCVAYLSSLKGEEHQWGTFSIENKSPEVLKATFWKLRSDAAAEAAVQTDDNNIRSAFSFLVLHEAYHVGQMAQMRIACDPDWNPYSIYKM